VVPKRLLATVAALTALAAFAGAETADEAVRLARGEVVITSEDVPGRWVPHVHATALLKAPPEKVWAIVSDCAHYKDNLPRVNESEEIFREGPITRCRETIDMPFPFSNLKLESEAVSTVEPGRRWVRAWHLREGDFNVNKGSWTLEPRDDGKATLATYEVLSEPKMRLPTFIVKIAQQKTLPEMFDRIRKKVE